MKYLGFSYGHIFPTAAGAWSARGGTLRHPAVQGVMALAAGGGTLHFQLQFSSVPPAGINHV